MISIVIVSHSAKLAEGVVELAQEMAGPDVQLIAAGGLDVPDRPLGTDAMRVLSAIEQVYSDDGVLVLMDLGSAILSAEMALDLLDPAYRPHVMLCSAPLVEGAVAAAVQARLGSPLEQVMAEAVNALLPKSAHLGAPVLTAPAAEPVFPAEPEHRLRLTIQNRLGLHARPAARLVRLVGRYQADIRIRSITRARGPVNARSINAVTTLGVSQDDEIEFTASGADAQEALEAIQALAGDNFGDTAYDTLLLRAETTATPVPLAAEGVLQGIPASPGLAVGPARLFHAVAPEIAQHTVSVPQVEWERLIAAIQKTRAQIQAIRATVTRQADQHAAGIFDAHLLFLDDEALLEPARRAIFEEYLNAAAAWNRAVEAVAAQYKALNDEYLRSRAADIQEVGQQVLVRLSNVNQSEVQPVLSEPGILIAADLTSAEVARLDPAQVFGICTAFGGPTSHSVILARSLNIPVVVGLGNAILAVSEGTQAMMDGDSGQVMVSPDEKIVRDFARRVETQRQSQRDAQAASADPAITRDGRQIEVVANIGSIPDVTAAVQAGAEGVGVLRTEFLFLNRKTAPSEDEQFAAYAVIAQTLAGRPLIIRTLDVGGDKPLPYIEHDNEANPFLGQRAIRLCLAHPELFKTQLRAIARTAAAFPTRIMFPMIATLDEFRAAKALLIEACMEISARAGTKPPYIETGIMVEIPAAALRADQFAPEVDFFSIGTNDLTQYTLAAERGNPRVAALADAFQPAVLQLIQQVVAAAHAYGKWVGVCGELAGEPLAAPLLVGLGVDELSMNAAAIPRIKQIIRTLDYVSAADMALAALGLETPDAIRAAVGRV